MPSEKQPSALESARRAEARAVMSLVEDALSIAGEELEKAESAEDRAATTDVPETFLGILEELQTANDQIAASTRRIAIYLVKDRGVTRKRVADALGVTAVTVWRWVKEHEEAEGQVDET